MPRQEPKAIWPLQLLNFFMADIQAGTGPFLAAFLLARGWDNGHIGSVMTIGGIAGVLMTAPAGASIDNTRHKRFFVIVPCLCVVLSSLVVLASQSFWIVAISQVATAMAGAAIIPAVTGITLGIVHLNNFNRQNGRNQAFNHAGNMAGAALSGFIGWKFGFTAVFWLAAFFGFLSILCVGLIPSHAIDHNAARGIKHHNDPQNDKANGLQILLSCKALLILAGALALFHLGNAAMLPLYGLAVIAKVHADPASSVAMTIVVAQAVMVIASLYAMHLAESRGYWLVLFLSFMALPIRGLVAALFVDQWGIYPVQFLDGIGAGLQSVAVPGLVARILDGTGRINAGQGAVMTAQGVGASLSPALGGWLVQGLGYETAFIILSSFAIGSLVLWIAFRSHLIPACSVMQMEQTRTSVRDP